MHYGVELPARCLTLIEQLYPAVAEVFQPGERHLGPLTTTFLLAMATPIIVLPIERIERHLGRRDEGYADESRLAGDVAANLRSVFGRRLGSAPFFQPGAWAFCETELEPQFNIASEFPVNLAERLGCENAARHARSIEVSRWASCLRNALSHGSVVYLDDQGRQSRGTPASGYAFVSERRSKISMECGHTESSLLGFNVLRISEQSFLNFLAAWVNWLQSCGVARDLAA